MADQKTNGILKDSNGDGTGVTGILTPELNRKLSLVSGLKNVLAQAAYSGTPYETLMGALLVATSELGVPLKTHVAQELSGTVADGSDPNGSDPKGFDPFTISAHASIIFWFTDRDGHTLDKSDGSPLWIAFAEKDFAERMNMLLHNYATRPQAEPQAEPQTEPQNGHDIDEFILE